MERGVQIGQNLKYGVLQKNEFKIVYVAPMKVHHGGLRAIIIKALVVFYRLHIFSFSTTYFKFRISDWRISRGRVVSMSGARSGAELVYLILLVTLHLKCLVGFCVECRLLQLR